MKKKNVIFKGFAIVLLLVWIISDIVLTKTDPLKYSPYFAKNDFEITQLKHPEKVWDKVFFGSSVVVSAFIEEESKSGYINAGIDYGTVWDIYSMLKQDKIKIGSDLVIGLNDITFLDSLPTNPSYIWHKKWYEHYIFFQRDKIFPLFENGVNNIMTRQPVLGEPVGKGAKKALYYGNLTDEELKANYENLNQRFGSFTAEDCTKNLKALKELIKLCDEKDIRLRAVWMPWNPKMEIYDFGKIIMDEVNAIFEENGIEVFDMTRMLEPQYFHDRGHISYEEGSKHFTKTVDEFLCQ